MAMAACCALIVQLYSPGDAYMCSSCDV